MKTKRLIAGLAAVVTLVSTSVSAMVTAAGDFAVKMNTVEKAAGESFTLTLDLENIPATGINACDFGISYDSSIVKVDKVALGSLAKDVAGVEADLPEPLECNIETDVINLMYALGTTDSAYFLNGTGTFLTISGTVNETAKEGADAVFKVVPVDRAEKPGSTTTNSSAIFAVLGSDGKETVYTPTFVDGHVIVPGTQNPTDAPTQAPTDAPTQAPTDAPTDAPTQAPTNAPTQAPKPTDAPIATEPINDALVTEYGDVNLDNGVDIADVVALNMYLLNPSVNKLSDVARANGDCFKDGVLNIDDSTAILNYCAQMLSKSDLGK